MKEYKIDLRTSERHFWEQVKEIDRKIQRSKLPWYKRIFA